jgi:cell division protein FtsI (penicillin-binding protein 3)
VIVVLALMAVFVLRLIDLQIIESGRLTAEANSRRGVERVLYGIRGEIVDTNGVVLASSVERYDITASPRYTGDFLRDGQTVTVKKALEEIEAITGTTLKDMYAAVTKDPESDFAYLSKSVTIDKLRQVQALNIPWVYSELRAARTYPRGAVAGNLVGFMGTDGPLTGVEYYKNDCLAGEDGSIIYERGADGIRIPGSTTVSKESTDGGSIRLTIDSDLQWYAQQVIQNQGEYLDAQWATAVVVRVKDGHILAAADWPSVDPNNVDGSKVDDMGSRFFTAPFEPGSIFKPMVVASMLDQGLITPETRIIAPGRFKVAEGKYIKDSFEHGDLKLTPTGVLVNSSNTGINVLAGDLSKQARYDILTGFGIGESTAVKFLGEDSGYIAKPGEVDDVTRYTELFGQGVTATGAQMASVYQTLGNHGVRMPLTLVEGCQMQDDTLTDLPSTEGTRVVSADAADTTIAMMENVAVSGSAASVVGVPGYRVAMKTGTAEVARYGKYTEDRIISVAGVAPAEDPQFAVVVTFGLPANEKTSFYAGSSFSKLMGQVLKYYRIQPSKGKTPEMTIEWGKG